jgi:hypothetical protein
MEREEARNTANGFASSRTVFGLPSQQRRAHRKGSDRLRTTFNAKIRSTRRRFRPRVAPKSRGFRVRLLGKQRRAWESGGGSDGTQPGSARRANAVPRDASERGVSRMRFTTIPNRRCNYPVRQHFLTSELAVPVSRFAAPRKAAQRNETSSLCSRKGLVALRSDLVRLRRTSGGVDAN